MWTARSAREAKEMTAHLSAGEIRKLGFEWPRYALVEKHCVIQDGKIDLATTVEKLRSSRSFYRKQLNAAFAFKQQTGADYADFTDRYDDYARMERELGEAIAYLEKVVKAVGA
jgi:hypothetical protein